MSVMPIHTFIAAKTFACMQRSTVVSRACVLHCVGSQKVEQSITL